MIRPEELAVLVNTLAIANNRDIPEIELYSAIFTQIADTLATIAIQKARIEECIELKKDKD